MALDFLAGCFGGCAGVLVGHPFDTVKVRLQCQDMSKPLYKGTINCFSTIIRQESVYGLYKGMASPMYGLALINAIVFGVQANCQRRMKNPDSLSSHFLAGSAAGSLQCIVCSPMELAKTRMQIQGQGDSPTTNRRLYKGPIDCLKKIYKHQGVKGIYRGIGFTLARETPGFGVYFAAYEQYCRWFTSKETGELSLVGLFFAGGFAGMSSWFSSYPFDVIKSRIQADGVGGVYKYKGYVDCIQKSISQEGLICLYRGLNSTLLRAFPVNAATFMVVTLVLRLSKADNDEIRRVELISESVASGA